METLERKDVAIGGKRQDTLVRSRSHVTGQCSEIVASADRPAWLAVHSWIRLTLPYCILREWSFQSS
jgi:hypothetical protein